MLIALFPSNFCFLVYSSAEVEKAESGVFPMAGKCRMGSNEVHMKNENAVKLLKASYAKQKNRTDLSPSPEKNQKFLMAARSPQEQELDNDLDPESFRSFLRDYLPNPKAPDRLKTWIRDLPYREPKLK